MSASSISRATTCVSSAAIHPYGTWAPTLSRDSWAAGALENDVLSMPFFFFNRVSGPPTGSLSPGTAQWANRPKGGEHTPPEAQGFQIPPNAFPRGEPRWKSWWKSEDIIGALPIWSFLFENAFGFLFEFLSILAVNKWKPRFLGTIVFITWEAFGRSGPS